MTVQRFKPTHSLTVTDREGASATILLRHDAGALYTEQEWDACVAADWELSPSGELIWQGSNQGPDAWATYELEPIEEAK